MTPRQAIAIQKRWSARVETRDRIDPVRHVAGFDVSVQDGCSRAAVVVFDAATLEPVESRVAEMAVPFPYVPGLLAFREIPALKRAFGKLRTKPQLGIVDGHGIAHPRRFGVASHLGVLLDLPTIGCAKSLLVGHFDPPAARRGSRSPILHLDRTVGAAVRTRDRVNPVFVSIGHRVSLPTAIRWVLKLAPRYRLAEPIRAADALAYAP